jgi:hypothetical protein
MVRSAKENPSNSLHRSESTGRTFLRCSRGNASNSLDEVGAFGFALASPGAGAGYHDRSVSLLGRHPADLTPSLGMCLDRPRGGCERSRRSGFSKERMTVGLHEMIRGRLRFPRARYNRLLFSTSVQPDIQAAFLFINRSAARSHIGRRKTSAVTIRGIDTNSTSVSTGLGGGKARGFFALRGRRGFTSRDPISVLSTICKPLEFRTSDRNLSTL